MGLLRGAQGRGLMKREKGRELTADARRTRKKREGGGGMNERKKRREVREGG